MNSKVDVTGMQIKTKVSSNLLVDNYTGGSWATNDTTFKASASQTITSSNVVVPLSTVNGVDFFYTDPTNVKGDGDAELDAYIAYSDLATLQEKYPDAEAAYLDYHIILKAENTSTSDLNINLSKLDLTYSAAADAEKAWRVAVLVKEFATAAVNGAKTDPGLPSAATKIYAPAGAVNFESGKAVSGTGATGSVTYASAVSDSTIATVAAGQTKYFNVVVRLWLEGEDKTCTVETFKGLDDENWSLETSFTLESGTTSGVYVLNMKTTA